MEKWGSRGIAARVEDRQSDCFVELYCLIEQAKCCTEIELNNYYRDVRLQVINSYKQDRSLSSLVDTLLHYSPTAYSALLEQQEQ